MIVSAETTLPQIGELQEQVNPMHAWVTCGTCPSCNSSNTNVMVQPSYGQIIGC
jgi:hypothetical protein